MPDEAAVGKRPAGDDEEVGVDHGVQGDGAGSFGALDGWILLYLYLPEILSCPLIPRLSLF